MTREETMTTSIKTAGRVVIVVALASAAAALALLAPVTVTRTGLLTVKTLLNRI